MERFKWQRDGKGGFVAYPEGEAAKTRSATIRRNNSSGDRPWSWWAGYDTAKRSGIASTQQEAADRVREVWPRLREQAAEDTREAAEREALRTLVQRMATHGDLPLSVFGIEQSDSERLRRIIWLLTHGGMGSIDGKAKPLVDACSAELYRRRTGA